MTDDVIDIICDHCSRITSPYSSVPIYTLGGAVARVPDEASAYPDRKASHDINVVGSWLPEDREPGRHIEWVRGFFRALEPHARSFTVNFTNDDSTGRLQLAFAGQEVGAARPSQGTTR